MKTDNQSSGKQIVDEYLKQLNHPFKAEIERLRSIMLSADPRLNERLKWNAPSFYYKRDLGAFNLRAKGFIQIVFIFYDGKMIDSEGLLQGSWTDRREARFYSLEDIERRATQLTKFIQKWIKYID